MLLILLKVLTNINIALLRYPSRPIFTVPLTSELTKVDAIAAEILICLVSKYTITNPEDQKLMC